MAEFFLLAASVNIRCFLLSEHFHNPAFPTQSFFASHSEIKMPSLQVKLSTKYSFFFHFWFFCFCYHWSNFIKLIINFLVQNQKTFSPFSNNGFASSQILHGKHHFIGHYFRQFSFCSYARKTYPLANLRPPHHHCLDDFLWILFSLP